MNILYALVKEILDRFFALIFLIVLVPFFFLIALLILINIGSPIFFTQLRPGFKCRPFRLIKFRTMSNQLDQNGNLLPDSKRLSKFGAWLRASSIDELPELINIIKGDMSFIGPRPLLMQYLSLYSPDQNKRHNVKPGFTGWAQINGRNTISWEEKFNLDLWYVKNQNLLIDLRILIITIFKVCKRSDITAPGSVTTHYFRGNEKHD